MSSSPFANSTSGSYNIGINVGESAGQPVAHTHIHVIPRFRSDTIDPRGTVWGLMPGQ